ncbi:hypothetical protein L227DRAFT_580923 [Lentinus tigrinus ALCF2SS1-6]|uniref:Uncharacterized protein n=1 Tax=Lentinus tigrinus ALCF2SS1-6 TaxID=1328759 RepID=A0A5C2RS90_9APHY|nr:hypothetical protein L227DRAFT_580923 [Lentinus tigrinus ALCF2SS1-6]
MAAEAAETRHQLNAKGGGCLLSNKVLVSVQALECDKNSPENQHVIHKTELELLGVDVEVKMVPSDDPKGIAYFVLPAPLPEGAEPRVAADGKTRLHNPNWYGAVSDARNRDFIDDVVALRI